MRRVLFKWYPLGAPAACSWAERECGRVDFPDARLRPRLLALAQAFGDHPTDPIPVALLGDAGQTKAAYREAVQWLLLTTVPTRTLEDAFKRLAEYAARWNIEVYHHRSLKSGCRIEDRRLASAASLQTCLALDLVVAWRVMYLAKLGRETPDVPCSVFFEEAE